MTAVQSEALHAARGNPGEALRQGRLAHGWSQAQVAQSLNLSPRIIEQLETGNYQQMPGHTFARGYTKAYGKLLGMDQAELVRSFDSYTGTDAKGSTVHSLGRLDEPVRLSRNVLRFVSFILVVIVIAMGLFWWQERSGNLSSPSSVSIEHVEVEGVDGKTEIHPLDEPEDQAAAEAQGETPPPAPVGTPLPDPNAAPAAPATSAAPSVPAHGSAVAPGAPPATTATAPTAPAPSTVTPAPSSVAPPATTAATAAGPGSLSLRFTADCWTQITDGAGKVAFSGVKKNGDSLDFQDLQAPINIRLGYARGVQLSYNGQPVNLAPFTKGETARLKLGPAEQ